MHGRASLLKQGSNQPIQANHYPRTYTYTAVQASQPSIGNPKESPTAANKPKPGTARREVFNQHTLQKHPTRQCMTINSSLSRYRAERRAPQSRRVPPTSQPRRNAQREMHRALSSSHTSTSPHVHATERSTGHLNPIEQFQPASHRKTPNGRCA